MPTPADRTRVAEIRKLQTELHIAHKRIANLEAALAAVDPGEYLPPIERLAPAAPAWPKGPRIAPTGLALAGIVPGTKAFTKSGIRLVYSGLCLDPTWPYLFREDGFDSRVYTYSEQGIFSFVSSQLDLEWVEGVNDPAPKPINLSECLPGDILIARNGREFEFSLAPGRKSFPFRGDQTNGVDHTFFRKDGTWAPYRKEHRWDIVAVQRPASGGIYLLQGKLP